MVEMGYPSPVQDPMENPLAIRTDQLAMNQGAIIADHLNVKGLLQDIAAEAHLRIHNVDRLGQTGLAKTWLNCMKHTIDTVSVYTCTYVYIYIYVCVCVCASFHSEPSDRYMYIVAGMSHCWQPTSDRNLEKVEVKITRTCWNNLLYQFWCFLYVLETFVNQIDYIIVHN